jgi:hypothetical protein
MSCTEYSDFILPFLHVSPQEQRQLTHENVQRKQARTGEEREEEEEEQISESESEDEENEIIYNPKNLPLGWDGKVRSQGPLSPSIMGMPELGNLMQSLSFSPSPTGCTSSTA